MYDGDALPLLANSDAIKVDQYVFQWTLSTRTRSLSGALLLRLRIGSSTEKEQISCCTGDISDRPKSEQSTRAPFVFVLDAFELDIGQVVASEEYLDVIPCLCEAAEGLKRLSFAVDEWSLRIWDRTVFHVKDFPPCVIIYYSTRVSGSLRWTTDANGDNLVYTPGVLVNNRGLLPCQDGPAVLATWTAMVSLDGFEEDIRVFMTGDTESRLQLPAESAGNGSSSALCWYFSNTDPAPVSTLGLLIGKFDVRHPRSSQFAWQLSPRCCVVSTPKQWKKGSITPRQLFEYVEAALQVTDKVLGKYPFPKLDIWITPATYESLGMAWPNLIYLHPAVLAEDGGMWVRIAHEISHAWYGLSIGQTDWSEEWMSEGFATYLEDIIHVRTMNKLYNWTEAAADRWIDPRMLTKYRQLCDQVENISQDLQVLQQPTVPGGVANGLNRPNYLKGRKFTVTLDAEASGFESQRDLWNRVFDARGRRAKDALLRQLPEYTEPVEIYLVLEHLHGVPEKISTADLQLVRKFYRVDVANADIRHAFCELIIMHDCLDLCPFVKDFVMNEQAMGKCIFSLMVLSRMKKFRDTAQIVSSVVGKDKDVFWWKEMNKILEPCFIPCGVLRVKPETSQPSRDITAESYEHKNPASDT